MGIDVSPDGHRIAAHIHVDLGGGDVWVIDAERGTNTRFTFDVNQHMLMSEFNESDASLSPDGRWIAYQSDESGRPPRSSSSPFL